MSQVLENYRAEEIRYFIVSSHYRSQLNYSEEQLEHARAALQRLYAALMDTRAAEAPADSEYRRRFDEAMCDDFNTASAVAVLFDLVRDINRARDSGDEVRHELASLLRELGGVIGLLQDDPETYLKSRAGQGQGLADAEIDALVAQRLQARAQKDWATADRLRDQLTAAGIEIEDGPEGTRWRRK